MSSKSKTSLPGIPKKASPATPRISRISRGASAKSEPDSHSPLQNPRLSVDRSPSSVTLKPAVDRRTPKVSTPPEKAQTRVVKGSELQAQLNLVQEDLKKAKEQIALIEKEKAQAIDDLKEAQRLAQKRAEDDLEIEKLWAVELEQTGVEVARKKEEEWQKELEDVRSQHALDVAALLSTTQDLQRVKQELAMTYDAKNQALSHADDATKIAEIHADKVEILSAELTRLRAWLDSKVETESSESNKRILKLKEEIDFLKRELDKAKSFEGKLVEKETSIEQLNVELEAAKMAELYARNFAVEWKNKFDKLESQLEKANKLERSASESLESVMKQLEGSNGLLHDAESEIAALKEKVRLLEMTIGRQNGDLEESEHCLDKAKVETSEMTKKVVSLKSELETIKEEKVQALNNEKLAASSVQNLFEEKHKLVNELENSRYEEEKSKKAMESLASALHEVSAEAREAKEKLLSSQVENENYETQVEDLKLVIETTNEKYESMLDNAKHEIDVLTKTIEQSREEFGNSKTEWERKELHLVTSVKKSEEESSSLGKEVDRLVNLLKQTEEETCNSKEAEVQLKDSLKEVESEVICLQEALSQAKAENMKLKENLLVKENELQGLIQENDDVRNREAVSVEKVDVLSKLLKEAMAKKETEENVELTDSEKDYDLLPKVVEFSEENGHAREEKPKVDLPAQPYEETQKVGAKEENNGVHNDKGVQSEAVRVENVNGQPKEDSSKEKEDDAVEVEFKMWESCKIERKEFSPEREPEQESFEEEVDSKVDDGESFDQINGLSSAENGDGGGSSPLKQRQLKKKKPLFRKFGGLLKKKGTSNQK